MTVFKVDHQSFADHVPDLSLFAIFSLGLLFESLIILITLFLIALNLVQLCMVFVCFAFLYSLLRNRI